MEIRATSWTAVRSSLGVFLVGGTDAWVTDVILPNAVPPGDVAITAASSRAAAAVHDAADQISDFLSGHRTSFDLPLRSSGTAFQEAVWHQILSIPYGSVESYGWVADHLDQPHGARAVGGALARNPLPIVRPCHRVVGSTTIGGYGGGIDLKRALLAIEGVHAA